jgi:hypothetical protein
MSVSLLSENMAMSFGGLGQDVVPLDKCFIFDVTAGWKEIEPAGVRPPRSAGHSAIYFSATSKMVVSFGMAAGPTLLDDQWLFDLATSAWTCLEGTSQQCKADKMMHQKLGFVQNRIHPEARPSARAFAAGVHVGLYQLILGGLVNQEKRCSPGVMKQVLVSSDEMWAMNTAYNSWFKIQQADTKPGARTFSHLASLDALGGYTNPTILFGGANTSCELDDPPCSVWQPLNDVWLIDATPANTSASDKMCQFDGIDDVIAVYLPS